MMKKIRCPRCGVINLEKFVTFPHCAGCGSILPQVAEVAEALPVWRRPLGPLLWVSVLAGAVAGLVVTATMFESAPVEPGPVLVYGRAARNLYMGNELTISLTLDTSDGIPGHENDELKDVSLRLSRDTLEKFDFVSLSPSPDTVLRSGTGRYLQYSSLSRDTQMELTLRPREVGTHAIVVNIYALDHTPSAPYSFTVRVSPPEPRVAPPLPPFFAPAPSSP